MFRLEITADSLQQFYADSANALLLITRGGQNLAAQPEQEPQQSQSVADTPAPGEAAAAVVAEPNPSVAPTPPPKKERKPRQGPPPTIEAKADPVVEPVQTIVDEDPLGLSEPAPKTDATPELTLQNMRERVQAILEAGKERGTDMKQLVPYVRELFKPFGIKLAAELKPEQFAEFWLKSQPYLDGTAPLPKAA